MLIGESRLKKSNKIKKALFKKVKTKMNINNKIIKYQFEK